MPPIKNTCGGLGIVVILLVLCRHLIDDLPKWQQRGDEHTGQSGVNDADKQPGDLFQRQLLERRMDNRLRLVGKAYLQAVKEMGRLPKTIDELKPRMPRGEDPISLRDGRPLEIASHLLPDLQKTMLVWEATADANGRRHVLLGVTPRCLSEEEFQRLRSLASTEAPVLPHASP